MDTKDYFLRVLSESPEVAQTCVDIGLVIEPILALEQITGSCIDSSQLRIASDDLSGCIAGKIPIILMGSNLWQIKRSENEGMAKARASKLASLISGRMNINKRIPMVNVVIPEKDHYCAGIVGTQGYYSAIEAGVRSFFETYSNSISTFKYFNIYSLPSELDKEDIRIRHCLDLSYFDSHLPLSYYIDIAKSILKELGIEFDSTLCNSYLTTKLGYGDLGVKLHKRPLDYTGEIAHSIDIEMLEHNRLLKYSPNVFEQPLSSTCQTIFNHQAKSEATVLILGDSHSSIMSQSKLTTLIAMHVSKVIFRWNPYLVNDTFKEDDLTNLAPDLIVNEISERFLFNLR